MQNVKNVIAFNIKIGRNNKLNYMQSVPADKCYALEGSC